MEKLKKEKIKSRDLVNLELSTLTNSGISSNRAEQFLREIEKDDERKIRLKRKLSEYHCVHLYESLARIGFSADQVSSVDNTILEKINVPLPQRESIIDTIAKERLRLEAGDTFHILQAISKSFY